MAHWWLSRLVDTAQGVVPRVARDQYLLDGQVSDWRDVSKEPGVAGGWALVRTPSARVAWHDPPGTFYLGDGLQSDAYPDTVQALADRLGVTPPAQVKVWRLLRYLWRTVPWLWRQPPVDTDGTITLRVGPLVDTFDQDDEPGHFVEPYPPGEPYPPPPRWTV